MPSRPEQLLLLSSLSVVDVCLERLLIIRYKQQYKETFKFDFVVAEEVVVDLQDRRCKGRSRISNQLC